MTMLRRALLPGLAILALGGCYTQLDPPGMDRSEDMPPQVSQLVPAEEAYTVYLYHLDARRFHDPFDLYRMGFRDPWGFSSSFHRSYRRYADPFYTPYSHSVRNSWRWYGGPVIWSPIGVLVDSRWRTRPDPLPMPLPHARPRIRRSGFEGPPESAADVRQTVPTTTYTPRSTPRPSASTPAPQEAPKQTQKKKEEEESSKEKREEKRKDQRRREGMR